MNDKEWARQHLEAADRLAAASREYASLPLARLAKVYRERAAGVMRGGVGRAALTS